MLRRFGVALLGVHAAIHLLGVVVYWRLGKPEGMTYRTELLGGVEIGDLGAVGFGAAWLVAAVLIAGGAAGLHMGWHRWRAVASAGLVLSLGITVLVWPDAGWGAVLDVLVLPALLVPRGVAGAGLGNTHDGRQARVQSGERRGAEWSHGRLYGRL